MMQLQKNMIYKLGFLDMMPIENLFLVPIVLIFNPEIYKLDVATKNLM
jgi:hypothetical protein